MADTPPPGSGTILSREERRNLLAQLERQSRKAEPPEAGAQRIEQALAAGHLEQARRDLEHLERTAPQMVGLAYLRDQLVDAEREEKRQANVRTAEEMLVGYIQQRKKQMAVLALETLLEIAPHHPRRTDYEGWVADLDQVAELQRKIEEQLSAGRAALRVGDMEQALRHLDTLHKVDPNGSSTAQFAGELSQAQRGVAQSADLERAKAQFEEHLRQGAVERAQALIDELSRLDIPKVSVDFLRKRLADTHSRVRDEAEREALRGRFLHALEGRDWQASRDLAQRFGELSPQSDEPARMFAEVNKREASERRRQSVEQGIATLEQFIAARQRREAELVLKVLRGLEIDAAQLARYEAQVEAL